MGIAFRRRSHRRPEDLLRDADAAMYRAKDRGRDRYEVFDDEMHARAVARLDIERSLRRAIDRRELRLHYQPILRLADARLRGFEVLVRWEHPERGLLLPGDFLRVAEETGLIVPIGSWVLQQACRQHARWSAGHPSAAEVHLAINFSARQVADIDLVAEVGSVLDETGVDPHLLDIEITEHVLMGDAPASVQLLRGLKGLGVSLAVDDFGTGYSSLAYLRRFPVDILKVDQAFVAGLATDPEDVEIVRLVLTLARTLGLRTIAEGVESSEQLGVLRHLGCDEVQGHQLSRPLTAAAAEAWLDALDVTLAPAAARAVEGDPLGAAIVEPAPAAVVLPLEHPTFDLRERTAHR
jgi:EAL domain-containing protein (putative c-di-GMP-specific phosphodiesterase class I)